MVDLVHELQSADRRASHPPGDAIRAGTAVVDGETQPALEVQASARVTYLVRMPERAAFHARVALLPSASPTGVLVRFGISNDRFYNELANVQVGPSPIGGPPMWQPIDVDLTLYSGWKWSVFYQPGRRTWKIILNANESPGGTVVWARPVITTW